MGDGYRLVTPYELGITEEIPEDRPTIEGNASQKSHYLYECTGGADCFADDTGLEVEALGGEPGVRSARYAGPGSHSQRNIELMMRTMEGIKYRRARIHLFEGIVGGVLLTVPRGTNGFGYDPIFVPDGYAETFAEMSDEAKNAISHRGRAVAKLAAFLNSRP